MNRIEGSSHSQLLVALKRLNFRQASEGLLCLQETDNNKDIEKENGDQADSQNGEASNTTDELKDGNTKANPSTSPKIDLIGQVKEIVGNRKSISNKCKVHVGNVGYKVRRREFREFFSYFGKVLHVEIVEDRAKRRSRGFGFVTFSNEWEAKKAKNSTDDERTLHGRIMMVSTPTRKRKGFYNKSSQEDQSLENALEEFKQLSLMQKKESSSVEESKPLLSSLNDDIIIHIFTFLSLRDKIRVEQVCRHWKFLVLKAWVSVTYLDFKDIFSLFKGGLTDYILLKVLQRGCKNLKIIDVSASPFLLTDFGIQCIAKHCKNLRTVNLSGVKLSTSSLKSLAKSCKKLETVILKRCNKVGEKGLWWLFKECTQLKYINISEINGLIGKCFYMLPPTVETLITSDCWRLTDHGAIFLADKCPNIKSLDLSGCKALTNDLFKNLEPCSKVHKLIFKDCPQAVNTIGLKLMISSFPNLIELDLSRCISVNDDLLFHIGQFSCHLQSLNIQDCGNDNDLTDAGIQSLVACYKLQDLDISYNSNITSESISQLAVNGSLTIFTARSCDGITDRAIESILAHCLNLSRLDVSGCSGISDESMQQIMTYYTESDKRSCLEFIMGGTSITDDKIDETKEKCHGIEIVNYNLSTNHTRFRDYMTAMPQFYPDSSEDDDDEELFNDYLDDNGHYDTGLHSNGGHYGDVYDDFLVADDPLIEEEHDWMFH